MNSTSGGGGAIRIAGVGHAFFAWTMIALGMVGLIKGDFTPTWSGVPKSFPARQLLPYLCGVISVACGIGLLLRRSAVIAAVVLIASLLMWMLVFRIPQFFIAPTAIGTWWAPGDTSVTIAAAWVLYAWFAADQNARRFKWATGETGLKIARAFYGVGLIPFGVAHFTNLNDTAPVVPAWIPWHVFWAYFTGGAFIAAGLAVLVGVCARLAASLSALQMALFTLLIWVPIVLTGGATPFQWAEFMNSWALTACAWVVADSYRDMPWLAAGKRQLLEQST